VRPGGGHAKGSNFERDICRVLTKWITGESRPEIFWRTSTSGGKFTQEAKGGIRGKMPGDIMSIDKKGAWLLPPDGAFVLECKNVRKVDFSRVLDGKGNLMEWWGKHYELCRSCGRRPMLIFKESVRKPMVMFSREDWVGFCSFLGNPSFSTMCFCLPELSLVCGLDSFLKWADSKALKHYFRSG
jgi:hypothetical protein